MCSEAGTIISANRTYTAIKVWTKCFHCSWRFKCNLFNDYRKNQMLYYLDIHVYYCFSLQLRNKRMNGVHQYVVYFDKGRKVNPGEEMPKF